MNTAELLYAGIVRFVFPLLALGFIALNLKCIFHNLKRKTLAKFATESYLDIIEIKSSECMIGRGAFCDVKLKDSLAAKRHALVCLTEYGFKITPTSEENRVYINGRLVEGEGYLNSGDKITIAGTTLQIAINPDIAGSSAISDDSLKTCRLASLFLLTAFQILAFGALLIGEVVSPLFCAISFLGIIATEWIYIPIRGFRSNVGVELTAFFLTSVGFCMCANVGEDALFKQTIMFFVGFIGFIFLSLLLKKQSIVESLRIPVMVIAVLLFLANIFLGVYVNGAKNWIALGPVTFQPSEFIKVALVFVSACALDKMLQLKNLITFLGFTFICLLSLAIIRDFGTAIVYFTALIIILCLRLCDVKFIALLCGSAALCAFIAIKLFPYISQRFETYGKAWEYASAEGYQQAQTMMSAASGGLFGLGLGNGSLSNVSAADTDLVFGMIAEEMGLIFALLAVICFALFTIYSGILITRTGSIYYAITASAASGIFIIQAILNIFGSVDLLPLTGVTLPFISNGGSSMIASWLLLSFIKASGSQLVKIDKSGGGIK